MIRCFTAHLLIMMTTRETCRPCNPTKSPRIKERGLCFYCREEIHLASGQTLTQVPHCSQIPVAIATKLMSSLYSICNLASNTPQLFYHLSLSKALRFRGLQQKKDMCLQYTSFILLYKLLAVCSRCLHYTFILGLSCIPC